MMKKIIFLPLLLFMLIPNNLSAQKKSNPKSTKSNSKKPTSADLEVQKFRRENPQLYNAHIMDLPGTEGSTQTNIDYSRFNGKNCSEIAKKEKWGSWNPPVDADKRCEKYLKMKKVKKVMFYPLIK